MGQLVHLAYGASAAFVTLRLHIVVTRDADELDAFGRCVHRHQHIDIAARRRADGAVCIDPAHEHRERIFRHIDVLRRLLDLRVIRVGIDDAGLLVKILIFLLIADHGAVRLIQDDRIAVRTI